MIRIPSDAAFTSLATGHLNQKHTMNQVSVCVCSFLFLSAALSIVFGADCVETCREKEDCMGNPSSGQCTNGLICCRNSGKSEQKCKEYANYVYQESEGVALMARSMTRRVSECNIDAVPLVVGGTKAKTKEFPHMAAIGYGNSPTKAKWLCGGSLISEKFVLSAAHCAQSLDSGQAKYVRMGSLNIKTTDANVQDFTIEKRIIHPKYKAPSRYHDIALFQLNKPVKMSGYTRPACLYSGRDETTLGKTVATGWGKTDYNLDEGSSDLMKVTLDFIDYATCNTSFSPDIGGVSLQGGIKSSSQLCAGQMAGGKDTCQGDSGGPLQIIRKQPYCMYDIVGVTSFGKFCGFKNSPAIYVKVSYYLPWIESVVWP